MREGLLVTTAGGPRVADGGGGYQISSVPMKGVYWINCDGQSIRDGSPAFYKIIYFWTRNNLNTK
jgi:hypothetical protein